MYAYQIIECPICEGFYFNPDNFDELCNNCSGYGKVPRKIRELYLFGKPIYGIKSYIEWGIAFKTKKAAIECIKFENDYPETTDAQILINKKGH